MSLTNSQINPAPTQFCHIAPTQSIEQAAQYSGRHLLLAHLVENNPDYLREWDELAERGDTRYRILDNSLFELYMEGKDPFDGSKLIDLAKRVGADCIVLPDAPGKSLLENIRQSDDVRKAANDNGFDTMFVPQCRFGNTDEYVEACYFGLETSKLTGISILGAPYAFGVDPKAKWQRYFTRRAAFDTLDAVGLIDQVRANTYGDNRFHCLGMTDGPREIELLSEFADTIESWDSSAAAWAAYEGVMFDPNSATGLRDGKVDTPVDFDAKWPDSKTVGRLVNNCAVINTYVRDCMAWG